MHKLFHETNIVVGKLNGEVVGFAGSRNEHISWRFVHSEHRRKGIASALQLHVMRAMGGDITLGLVKGNIGAQALYKRCGFLVECEFEGGFLGKLCQVVGMRYSRSPV